MIIHIVRAESVIAVFSMACAAWKLHGSVIRLNPLNEAVKRHPKKDLHRTDSSLSLALKCGLAYQQKTCPAQDCLSINAKKGMIAWSLRKRSVTVQ
jgi:hypothetical protein